MQETWVVPGLGRSPGEGKGCPAQYSGLESSVDCVVRGVAKSRTLNSFHFHFHSWFTMYYFQVCSPVMQFFICFFRFFSLMWSVTQLYPTFCGPMHCSLSGSSVHGNFQTRILEWVAISYSRGSSRPKDQTHVSCISHTGGWILYH